MTVVDSPGSQDSPEPTHTGWRDVRVREVEITGRKGVYENSWAVVIGINRYERHSPLTFAVPDAASIAETLISHLDFPAGNVFLVLDPPEALPEKAAAWLARTRDELGGFHDRATKTVIEQLLITTLPDCAGPDDRVLVYFAGHGTPRRVSGGASSDARPYLIPADAVESRWDTYIDLRTIAAHSHFVAAKHVLYLLDACCAGLVGMRASTQLSRYEQDLLHRRARQCITAGTAEGVAADLGHEGHSPFTWHVLQVLRGEVRLGEDGLISATTLTAYVKETVGKESRQIPDGFALDGHEGGEFVFSSSRAPLTAEERVILARLLVQEVGLRLEEPSSIELAATLWQALADTASSGEARRAEARRELARAHLLLGRATQARDLLAEPCLASDAEAALLRGIACLRLKDADGAVAELVRFADDHAEHRYAAWARRAASSAQRRRHALLVGVESVGGLTPANLRGVTNDIASMSDLLRNQFAFDTIQTLQNEQATAEGVRAAFDAFAASTRPEDSFVFYFTGHGATKDDKTFLMVHDTSYKDGILFSEDDLDAAMRALPAHDKLVITDGCYLAPRPDRRSLGYRYLAGGSRDQATFEYLTADGTYRGAFTVALEQEIRESGNARLQDVWPRVQVEVMKRFISQTPSYVGPPNATLFDDENLALRILDLGERGIRGPLSSRRIDQCAQWLRSSPPVSAMAPFWLGVGRAWLAKQDYAASIDVLTELDVPDTCLPLIHARLSCNRHGEAADGWERCRATHPAMALDDIGERSAAELTALLAQLRRSPRHALLVMVGAHTGQAWTAQPVDTLASIRDALVQRCAFRSEDVAILCDPDRDALLRACQTLSMQAGAEPTFLLFVGPGFDGRETWISSDAPGQSWHVAISEIGARMPHSVNLSSAIFVTRNHASHEALVAARLPPPGGHRGDPPPLGRTSLVVVPRRTRDVERVMPPDRAWLVDVLTDHATPSFSAKDWFANMQHPAGVSVRGDREASLFSYVSARRDALRLVRDIEQAPLRRMVPLLTRLAADRGLAIPACIQRGIVHGELGHYEEAASDLDAAEDRHQQRHAPRGTPPRAPVASWPELHYQRGRILLEAALCGRAEYTEALAELSMAVRGDAGHARAHYYRALAIRRLIEADLERQARESEQRYRELGAPLGIDDDTGEP